ncbi:MAG: DUF167 domain-containing protein [Coxiellaceae bacterium]|nr:DUF167 domain-containing protein [Coxiellaceae bacterium]
MKTEFILTVYLQPDAKKSEIVGLHDGNIKIKVKSPPVDGKANAALINFISEFFDAPKSSITIISGDKSRLKKVAIANLSDTQQQKIIHYMK